MFCFSLWVSHRIRYTLTDSKWLHRVVVDTQHMVCWALKERPMFDDRPMQTPRTGSKNTLWPREIHRKTNTQPHRAHVKGRINVLKHSTLKPVNITSRKKLQLKMALCACKQAASSNLHSGFRWKGRAAGYLRSSKFTLTCLLTGRGAFGSCFLTHGYFTPQLPESGLTW